MSTSRRIFIAVFGMIAGAQFAHADSPSVTAVLNSSEAVAGRNGATGNSSHRSTWRRRAGGDHGGRSRNSANRNVTTHRDEQSQPNLQCGIRLHCDAVESGKIHDPASNHSRRKQFAAHPGVDFKRRGFVRPFVWAPGLAAIHRQPAQTIWFLPS